MSFKISTLNEVIPSPLCSIIDPFMKHTRILATPNTQVRLYFLLVGAFIREDGDSNSNKNCIKENKGPSQREVGICRGARAQSEN